MHFWTTLSVHTFPKDLFMHKILSVSTTVTIFPSSFYVIFRSYSPAAFRVRDVDEWPWDGATKDVALLHSYASLRPPLPSNMSEYSGIPQMIHLHSSNKAYSTKPYLREMSVVFAELFDSPTVRNRE